MKSTLTSMAFLMALFGALSPAGANSTCNDLPRNLKTEINQQYAAQTVANSKLQLEAIQIEQARIKSVNMIAEEEGKRRIEEYKIRAQIINRQLIYHPIILGMVTLIVVAGVIFSSLQAWKDLRSSPSNASSLRISSSGLEVSSAVIGLITLSMSFAFFYLYATKIYPITQLGASELATAQAAPNDPPPVGPVPKPIVRSVPAKNKPTKTETLN